MFVRKTAFLMLAALGLGACSGLSFNEGSVSVSNLSATNSHGGSNINYRTMYMKGANKIDDVAKTIIQPNEAYSINLISGFICDFREAGFANVFGISNSNEGAKACLGGRGRAHSGNRGELVIIADVKEELQGSLVSNTVSESLKKGRVVFYSEDIRQTGQLINAGNISLQAPSLYKGNAVRMKLDMVELDNTVGDQVKPLLKQLAAIGSKSSVFASIPVLSLVSELGGALLQQNRDDLELSYSFRFDPHYKQTDWSNTVRRSPLREGYYAILRNENRSQSVADAVKQGGGDIHGQLFVCPETGMLATDKSCQTVYRGQTWFLIRIAREDKKHTFSSEVADDFEAFRARLSKEARSNTSDLRTFLDNVGGTIPAGHDDDAFGVKQLLKAVSEASNPATNATEQ